MTREYCIRSINKETGEEVYDRFQARSPEDAVALWRQWYDEDKTECLDIYLKVSED